MTRATWVGVVALVVVVWLAAAGAHVTVGTGPTPAPSVAPTPLPTPTSAPDPFAPARWAAANVAVIFLMLAIGVGLPVGIALHNWHRSKLPTEDWRVPYRAPQFPRALDAHVRTSFPPVPQTYSPSLHIRNDPGVEVEQPPMALPALPGIEELLTHGHGLAYGWRTDNGQLLVDKQIRSLLVGGVQGSGKTSFVALLVAQLVRMNARVMLGDPDALNEQGLASRLAGLGIQPEVRAQEPAEVLRLILNAQHELMTRRDQERYADPRPYVVAVDEVPECLRVLNRYDSRRLRDALELIGGLKGRKLHVAVILMAQGWSQAVIGSTTMRDLIPTSAVFRQRAEQAERLCGLKPGYWRAVGPDPMELEPGTFYAVGLDSGAVRLRVPEVPPHSETHARTRVIGDSEPNRRVRPELNRSVRNEFGTGSPALPGTRSEPAANPSEPAPNPRTEPVELPPALEETKVLELLRRGFDIGRVIRDLTGLKRGEEYRRLHLAVQRWLVSRMEGR